MRSRPHIVYLSFDGLLEPLGYSQVVRVVAGLADGAGIRMTICSLEKPGDREDGDREEALEAELLGRTIRWRRRSFSTGGGPLEVARNVEAMRSMVAEIVDDEGVDLLHARSYVAASVARFVFRRHGVPYLFDTRGFWVDERLERGRWFGGPIGEEAARIWEAGLYRDCAGAVTLTEVAAERIRAGARGRWPADRPLAVIPTCVDYDEFEVAGDDEVPVELEDAAIGEGPVIGYIGAVNQAYRLRDSLRLFDHILARRPEAHLVCLTRERDQMRRAIDRQGLPSAKTTVTTADHRRMPAWLGRIDWGLLLRDTADDQRAYLGAMPTKLGEFFAAGVRPLYAGHNPEVRRWVERAKSGHLLASCDEEALRRAADRVATTPVSDQTLWGARWRTRGHFGLGSAVERYRRLYDEILTDHRRTRLKVLFLTEGTTVPASRFRVEQLIPHLEARGIECTVRPAYGDGYNRWSSTPAGPLYKLACSLQRFPWSVDGDRFDVVFLQRPALPFSAAAERLANWRNPHTIFDVDDAIFVGPDGEPNRRQQEVFDAIVDRCAHVICGNEYLADRTRHRTPTSVIPTVVDTEVYRPVDGGGDGGSDGDRIVIGWMGTASNFESLGLVAPLLGRLAAEFASVDVELVSNRRYEPLDDVDGVEQFLWSADDEVERLQGFDIGLMPLVDNRATRGKCGFKAIQYMACGLPVVASPVGVNTEIFDGERAGLLADGPDEFESALRQLIADGQRRREMGRVGRRIVERRYSVDAVIDRYVELLESVARRGPSRPKTLEAGTSTGSGHRPAEAARF